MIFLIRILKCLLTLGWEHVWLSGESVAGVSVWAQLKMQICWVFIRKGHNRELAAAASLPQKSCFRLEGRRCALSRPGSRSIPKWRSLIELERNGAGDQQDSAWVWKGAEPKDKALDATVDLQSIYSSSGRGSEYSHLSSASRRARRGGLGIWLEYLLPLVRFSERVPPGGDPGPTGGFMSPCFPRNALGKAEWWVMMGSLGLSASAPAPTTPPRKWMNIWMDGAKSLEIVQSYTLSSAWYTTNT